MNITHRLTLIALSATAAIALTGCASHPRYYAAAPPPRLVLLTVLETLHVSKRNTVTLSKAKDLSELDQPPHACSFCHKRVPYSREADVWAFARKREPKPQTLYLTSIETRQHVCSHPILKTASTKSA